MVVLAATLDVSELGFFLLGERARTKSLGTTLDLSEVFGGETGELGRGRGAHHDVVIPVLIEHESSIAEIERNARIIFSFFTSCNHCSGGDHHPRGLSPRCHPHGLASRMGTLRGLQWHGRECKRDPLGNHPHESRGRGGLPRPQARHLRVQRSRCHSL